MVRGKCVEVRAVLIPERSDVKFGSWGTRDAGCFPGPARQRHWSASLALHACGPGRMASVPSPRGSVLVTSLLLFVALRVDESESVFFADI